MLDALPRTTRSHHPEVQHMIANPPRIRTTTPITQRIMQSGVAVALTILSLMLATPAIASESASGTDIGAFNDHDRYCRL